MGVLGAFGRKRPKKYKNRPEGEKMLADVRRWVAGLRRTNPALHDELMLQMAQRTMLAGGGGPTGQLRETLELLDALRQREEQHDPKLAGLQMIGSLLGALGQGALRGPPPAQTVEVLPTQPLELPEAPAPAGGAGPAAAPAPPPGRPGSAPVAAGVSALMIGRAPHSYAVCSGLAGKSPDAAAAWLLDQSNGREDVTALIRRLCETPDERLGEVLDEIARHVPELGEAVGWLRRQEPWLRATVRVLRERTGISPVAAE